jgi:hypothetical protein
MAGDRLIDSNNNKCVTFELKINRNLVRKVLYAVEKSIGCNDNKLNN